MNDSSNGYTLWARQTLESKIFFYKSAVWFKIWFYLVSQANYGDSNLLKKGEVFSTYEEIMRATKASKTQVHDCIHYLESDNMITSRKTTRGMVRLILKYSLFQDPKTYMTTPRQQARQLQGSADNRNIKQKEYKEIDILLVANQTGVPLEVAKAEWEKASDWLKSNGRVKKDYNAFLRNWIRDRDKFKPVEKAKRSDLFSSLVDSYDKRSETSTTDR